MGQAIRKVYGAAVREIKTYNVERRAEKVISKEKPTRAPMHKSTIEELDRLQQENVSMEYLHKKDEALDEYLKKVYVTTPDPVPSVKRVENPLRPMPQNRRQVNLETISYGYSASEEETVPVGRVSLKQALQFISDHKADPTTHTNTAIAAKYKLDLPTTDDILEHFLMLDIRIQKKEVDPDSLTTFQKIQKKFESLTISNYPKVVKNIDEEIKIYYAKELEEKDKPKSASSQTVIKDDEYSKKEEIKTGRKENQENKSSKKDSDESR